MKRNRIFKHLTSTSFSWLAQVVEGLAQRGSAERCDWCSTAPPVRKGS